MTEADILHWIRDTSLGVAVRQSRWMFATGETLHFLGLSLLVGGILIVDLRLLGFLRHISMRSALSFLPFAIIGFVINLLTGILFFTADPMMYWPNPAFRLKMFLILLAGINALIFTLFKHRQALALGDDDQATTFMKVVAWSSSPSASACLCLNSVKMSALMPASRMRNIFSRNAGLGQYIIGSAVKNRMPVKILITKPMIANGRKASAERIEMWRRKPSSRRSTIRMPPTRSDRPRKWNVSPVANIQRLCRTAAPSEVSLIQCRMSASVIAYQPVLGVSLRS